MKLGMGRLRADSIACPGTALAIRVRFGIILFEPELGAPVGGRDVNRSRHFAGGVTSSGPNSANDALGSSRLSPVPRTGSRDESARDGIRHGSRRGLYLDTKHIRGVAGHMQWRAIENQTANKRIAGIVHEATHRYIDVKLKGTAQWEKWTNWYAGVPLKRGRGFVNDPSRVADEAAAGYVQHRVQLTLDTLGEIRRAARLGRLPEMLPGIAERYNAKAAENVFGYDYQGSSQAPVDREMPAGMREYFDKEVLGGQVGAGSDGKTAFEQDRAVQAYLGKAQAAQAQSQTAK